MAVLLLVVFILAKAFVLILALVLTFCWWLFLLSTVVFPIHYHAANVPAGHLKTGS